MAQADNILPITGVWTLSNLDTFLCQFRLILVFIVLRTGCRRLVMEQRTMKVEGCLVSIDMNLYYSSSWPTHWCHCCAVWSHICQCLLGCTNLRWSSDQIHDISYVVNGGPSTSGDSNSTSSISSALTNLQVRVQYNISVIAVSTYLGSEIASTVFVLDSSYSAMMICE